MSSSFRIFAVSSSLLAAATLALVGCNQSAGPDVSMSDSAKSQATVVTPASASPAATQEHPHIPGAHGGIVIPIGSDSYHAEAVIEKDGMFRLLMLGADETRIQEVDVQAVKAYVKVSGNTDAVSIDMNSTPQEGDSEGKTSQFLGQLPEAAVGKAIDVTIPNLRIGKERFRVGFTTAVQSHDEEMPAAVTGDEEQQLYFTAGGKYTEADITANGPLPAAIKFRGLMSKHDMKPEPGDLICPVTFTKANPKIEWQVNGKKYLFCCPPCVDEFVRMAKEDPDSILEPADYAQGERKADGQTSKSSSEVSPASHEDLEVLEALSGLSPEDRAQADSQKFCGVNTDSLLGSMGPPIKVDINGETVFLCCDACKAKALRNADATLANVAKLKQDNAAKR